MVFLQFRIRKINNYRVNLLNPYWHSVGVFLYNRKKKEIIDGNNIDKASLLKGIEWPC